VCGIDHFCNGHGSCVRCPGVYMKPTQACERIDANDPKSEGNYVEGKAVKLAFSTVGDDLFYLAAEPNATQALEESPASPPPAGNGTDAGNSTAPTEPAPVHDPIDAHLSTTPSKHVIEEVTAGSGEYRVLFNDSVGGYLHVILPPASSTTESTDGNTALIDLKTLGVAQIQRDFSQWTTFYVEHSASFSWRFRVGNDENAKYLAWCGQATCGQGVPNLRLMSSMFCGSLTTSGIRCDVMVIN